MNSLQSLFEMRFRFCARAAARIGVPAPTIKRCTSPRDFLGGHATPQFSAREFERLPLRVHTFLAGVPLHDVWAVDLPLTTGPRLLGLLPRILETGATDPCTCA